MSKWRTQAERIEQKALEFRERAARVRAKKAKRFERAENAASYWKRRARLLEQRLKLASADYVLRGEGE